MNLILMLMFAAASPSCAQLDVDAGQMAEIREGFKQAGIRVQQNHRFDPIAIDTEPISLLFDRLSKESKAMFTGPGKPDAQGVPLDLTVWLVEVDNSLDQREETRGELRSLPYTRAFSSLEARSIRITFSRDGNSHIEILRYHVRLSGELLSVENQVIDETPERVIEAGRGGGVINFKQEVVEPASPAEMKPAWDELVKELLKLGPRVAA